MRNLDGRLTQALASMGRVDIAPLQVDKVSDTKAKCFFRYRPNLGMPMAADLDKLFAKHFPELTSKPNTLARVAEDAFVVTAELKQTRRPITDRTKLQTVIADLKFMDTSMGTIWDVSQDENGQQVLQQVNKVDISALVHERARRMGQPISASLRATKLTAGIPGVQVGDTVKFWSNNQLGEGQIVKLSDEQALINCMGEECAIHPDGIYKIVESNKSKNKMNTAYEQEYWKQAVGPEFARELVKK